MKARKTLGYFLSAIFMCSSILEAAAPNTVVATIPVGENPAGIAITADSRYAYVANNNNDGVPGGYTVNVLDLQSNTVIQTIADPSFEEPYTITLNPAGTKAYVTNSNGTTVTIIDTATNTVTGTIGGFDGPSGMAITPDGIYGYVNNYGGPGGVGSGNGTTVSFVNLNTNTIVGAPIVVGLAPAALAITPDGAYVYVINYTDGNIGTGTVSIIRTSDNSVQLNAITGFSGPFAIAITPDGRYAYVTNFGSNNFMPIGNTVSIIDLSTNGVLNVLVGIQPAGVAITPDGSLAYSTNYNTLYNGPGFTDLTASQGTVNIISVNEKKTINPIIGVGLSPGQIAISPNGQFAYTTNYTSNDVSVIALPYFSITAQGRKVSTRFATQTIYSNELTWSAAGNAPPVTYSIYRNADLTDLVAVVPGTGPLVFVERNVSKKLSYTYYITGTDEFGTISAPVAVTIL